MRILHNCLLFDYDESRNRSPPWFGKRTWLEQVCLTSAYFQKIARKGLKRLIKIKNFFGKGRMLSHSCNNLITSHGVKFFEIEKANYVIFFLICCVRFRLQNRVASLICCAGNRTKVCSTLACLKCLPYELFITKWSHFMQWNIFCVYQGGCRS